MSSGRVLICCLNWGLGHASRCVALADIFQQLNWDVTFASDGSAKTFLQVQKPDVECLDLPTLSLRYSSRNNMLNLGRLVPRLWNNYLADRRVIQSITLQEKPDLIVSDSRLGCFHTDIPSFFLTHQLHLPIPSVIGKVVQSVYEKALKRFQQIWIPDTSDQDNLSGKLGHPVPSYPHLYIGPLSNLKDTRSVKSYRTVAVLSGPEPFRDHLEKSLLEVLVETDGNHLVILGKPHVAFDRQMGNIRIRSFLAGKQLSRAICSAQILIARSGYSTIMDLSRLGIPAILTPTPGQPEQEYLANYHKERDSILTVPASFKV